MVNNCFDMLPPSSIDAEQAVLGSMLLDNDVIDEVQAIVQADSFLRKEHQEVFAAICDMYEYGGAADAMLLYEELKLRGQTQDNTAEYIAKIVDSMPTAANAAYYAKIVADKYLARKVIHAATEIVRNGYDETGPSTELVERAEQSIQQIIRAAQVHSTTTIRDACLKFISGLRAGHGRIVPSGIYSVDDAIGGVAMGEMLVVGARTSNGKSAFALQWLHQASRDGIPSLMISEEMAATELGKRSLLRISSIDQDIWNAESADVLEQETKTFYNGAAPIYIAEHCGTISKAERMIRRYADMGVKLVALDYLQLLQGAGAKRHEQVGEVSRRIKQCAQKYDIAIIALSQLNREIENRKVYTPMLRDIRESGAIEQDADCVLFLIWPWAVWNEDADSQAGNVKKSEPRVPPDKTEYRVYVGKNCRNRRTKRRRMIIRFDSERQTFYCTESAHSEAAIPEDFFSQ